MNNFGEVVEEKVEEKASFVKRSILNLCLFWVVSLGFYSIYWLNSVKKESIKDDAKKEYNLKALKKSTIVYGILLSFGWICILVGCFGNPFIKTIFILIGIAIFVCLCKGYIDFTKETIGRFRLPCTRLQSFGISAISIFIIFGWLGLAVICQKIFNDPDKPVVIKKKPIVKKVAGVLKGTTLQKVNPKGKPQASSQGNKPIKK